MKTTCREEASSCDSRRAARSIAEFDGDGVVNLQPTRADYGQDYYSSLSASADGSLTLSRMDYLGGGRVFRLTPAGAIDGTFAGNGGVGLQSFERVTPTANGGFLITQIYNQPGLPAGNGLLIVTKHRPDGKRDPAFGTKGVATKVMPVDEFEGSVDDVAIDGAGRVTVLWHYSYYNSATRLTQFNSAGVWDKTFGSTGYVRLDSAVGANGNSARDLTIDGANRIRVGASVEDGVRYDGSDQNRATETYRFSPRGKLDLTFGGNGAAQTTVVDGAAATYRSRGRGPAELGTLTRVGANFVGVIDRDYSRLAVINDAGQVLREQVLSVPLNRGDLVVRAEGKLVVANQNDDSLGFDLYSADGRRDAAFAKRAQYRQRYYYALYDAVELVALGNGQVAFNRDGFGL